LSRLRPIPVLLTLFIPIPLIAQTAPTVAERVLAAASIPGLALEARAGGVPPDELEGLLDALADGRVSGPDARLVLAEERRTAAANGAVPGLGAFVRARLAEGLRGQALAEAIGKEHAARGRKGARSTSQICTTSTSSLRAPHSGQVQFVGTAAQAVPAAMPCSGSPRDSS
jgi:hypothetical protein